MSKCKTTVVTFEEFSDIDYRPPSNYYIREASGNFIYFHTRSRETAQEWCDIIYSKGFYKVNAAKTGKAPEKESAVGRLNMKSRMNSKGVR